MKHTPRFLRRRVWKQGRSGQLWRRQASAPNHVQLQDTIKVKRGNAALRMELQGSLCLASETLKVGLENGRRRVSHKALNGGHILTPR
eukprot:3586070-Amphidinium_carterae.1